MSTARILTGDALEQLRTLSDQSAHCCVTSPPYWGLRDYGVDGQLGLEPTPEEYVEKIVEVFREVRRVLRNDGTLWLNLGDSYNGAGRTGHGTRIGYKQQTNRASAVGAYDVRPNAPALKPKDLVGIPWRVAFALQADGWWLRSDIIWHKESCMPESVTDRPTSAHEHIFLLAKSERYFYDAQAIAEPAKSAGRVVSYDGSQKNTDHENRTYPGQGGERDIEVKATRNKRNVWTVNPKPFPEAHFAVYPPDLVEPCIKAGTSEKGACAECGAPWERVVENTGRMVQQQNGPGTAKAHIAANGAHGDSSSLTTGFSPEKKTTGWQPTCKCDTDEVVPCTVLDPFAGSGTTGMVATGHGRDPILIDLNPDYVEMMKKRIGPMFVETA